MAQSLTYNLKYRKEKFNKILLEKDGEMIIGRKFFRLKGKGGQDQGELIYFDDIYEMIVMDDELKIMTLKKEIYILNNFFNLFDTFLKDFFRVRNEYLAEALFMKLGRLYHEYEGQVEIVNRLGKTFPKGKVRICFYESSMVIFPQQSDCFAIFFNFLKKHERDEEDYTLTLSTETGSTVQISKLGTSFDDACETLETLLSKMYERSVNYLKEFFPDLDPGTLLKIAILIREGKSVPLAAFKKIQKELPEKISDLLLQTSHPLMREKVKTLTKMADESDIQVGFSFYYPEGDTRNVQVRSWFLISFPKKNLIALGMTSNPNDHTVYFFRILMENSDMQEKLTHKILEINQSMFLFHLDLGPLYKNKWELKRSKYRSALKRLVFVRLLRKSYLDKSNSSDVETFKNDLEKFTKLAGESLTNTVAAQS
jgi:hypothetical protein